MPQFRKMIIKINKLINKNQPKEAIMKMDSKNYNKNKVKIRIQNHKEIKIDILKLKKICLQIMAKGIILI